MSFFKEASEPFHEEVQNVPSRIPGWLGSAAITLAAIEAYDGHAVTAASVLVGGLALYGGAKNLLQHDEG